MKKVKTFFLLMVMFLSASQLFALTVEYVGLDRLSKEANMIVSGKVISSYSVWEDNCIYTYTTLAVSEMLKGETVSKKIVVKQMGGTVGQISQTVDGTPKLILNDNVVLFLSYWKGAYWIHSIVLGHFNVIEENGIKYAFNNLNNIGLIDPITKKHITEVNRKENRIELNSFVTAVKDYLKN